MRLVDLNPQWLSSGGAGVSDQEGNPVPRRDKVAIKFDCPCGSDECKKPWKRVCLTLSNPPDGGPPVSSKMEHSWEMSGDSFENLTLKPSIQRVGGCEWHGWVTKGEVITA